MARTVPIEKPEDSVALEYTRVLRIFSEGVGTEQDQRSQWLSGRTIFCVKA